MFLNLTLLFKNKVSDNKVEQMSKSMLINTDSIMLVEPFPVVGVEGSQVTLVNGAKMHVKETKNQIGLFLGIKSEEDSPNAMQKILDEEKRLKESKKKVVSKRKKKK